MEVKQVSPATSLIGFGDIRKEPIDDWQEFLAEGNQFLATASKAYSGGRKAFTSEILYNLVAMAIEKLIMALLMESGNLPYNHTMHDLVESMEEFLPGELGNLGEELKALDAFQEICDPYNFKITIPTRVEVARMLELAGKVRILAERRINN